MSDETEPFGSEDESLEAPEPEEAPKAAPTPEMARSEPLLSGGFWKAIGLLLAAAIVGGGTLLLWTGVDGIDLPDIDISEITETDAVVNLEDTTLEETTINGESGEPADPFTSAEFAEAIDAVRTEAGASAEVTRLFINEVQTQFIVRRGEGVEAYGVRADTGELVRETATITITGNATVKDFAFGLDSVDPAAVDRMLARSGKLSGGGEFEPSVLSLERDLSAGLRPPEWTINGFAGNRSYTLRARADGTGVRDIGGGGTEIPAAAVEARKLAACIQDAAGDPEEIQDCFDDFGG